MPYIRKEERKAFDNSLKTLSALINTEGQMNYCFYKLCLNWVKLVGKNYNSLSTCISVLENAKLEFYRRQVASYEDKKIIENGDIS